MPSTLLEKQKSYMNSQASQLQFQFSCLAVEQAQTLKKKKLNTSFLDKYKKNLKQYNELVLADKYFKQVYADNLKSAIFTFPKFKRNYSKNYAKVQSSFAKYSSKKKTIIFDIDETLVYATHSTTEMPTDAVDTSIRIKVNKYGGAQKAYLSFRPHLFDMLNELYEDFELILYTVGTQSYAKAFSEAVHKFYMDKFPKGHHAYHVPAPENNFAKEFSLFDHVLSL